MESPDPRLKSSRQVRMEARKGNEKLGSVSWQGLPSKSVTGVIHAEMTGCERICLCYLVNSTCVWLSFFYFHSHPDSLGLYPFMWSLWTWLASVQNRRTSGEKEHAKGEAVWDKDAETQKLAWSCWLKLYWFSNPGSAVSFLLWLTRQTLLEKLRFQSPWNQKIKGLREGKKKPIILEIWSIKCLRVCKGI